MRVNRKNFFLVIVLFLLSSFTLLSQSSDKKYVMIGYLAGTDWAKHEVDVSRLTHINYAFAVPAADGRLEKISPKDSLNLIHLNSLKKDNKDLKILISIGGWGGSNYFSDAALTEASREIFAISSIEFMKQFNLDGVDIDWEYPDQPGNNNIFRPEDKKNFTLLLKILREKLDEQAAKEGRGEDQKFLLTIATGVDTAFINHTELGEAQKYLDYVNIMTYDIYHGNDKNTGHHSNLYQSSKGNQSRNSTFDAVKAHIKEGIPAEKIVVGIPFYGRGWSDVNNKNNGLYEPSKGKHFSVGYEKLMADYINKNDFVRYWDEEAKVPYLWNAKTKTFISYNDEESLKYKTDFVKQQGLAGVMFWEYSHDMKDGKLLNTLYNGLK